MTGHIHTQSWISNVEACGLSVPWEVPIEKILKFFALDTRALKTLASTSLVYISFHDSYETLYERNLSPDSNLATQSWKLWSVWDMWRPIKRNPHISNSTRIETLHTVHSLRESIECARSPKPTGAPERTQNLFPKRFRSCQCHRFNLMRYSRGKVYVWDSALYSGIRHL